MTIDPAKEDLPEAVLRMFVRLPEALCWMPAVKHVYV